MNLLGIDVGTTSLKAVLFDENGKCLAETNLDYTLITKGDFIEFDAMDYIRITRQAIDEIKKTAPIDAIAVDTQGETLILTDEAGNPTTNAIVWLDMRAVEEADEIRAHFGQEKLYTVTGQAETSAGWPACKLLWVQRHLPEVWAKTKRVFLLEDWILWALTGEFVTEPTIQSSSFYLDVHKRDWWKEMLDFINVDLSMMPKVLPSGTEIGSFEGARVCTGCFDQVAGAIGVGVINEDVISEMTGTAMAISVVTSDYPAYDPKSVIPTHLHAVPGKYVRLMWLSTAGMVLKWYRNAFAGDMSFKELDELAEKAGPGAEGLVMLPYFTGSVMPVYNPDAKGAFYGVTLAHGKGHFARAILEAVAFTLKDNLDCVGVKAHEIRITGGGAGSPLWSQIKADVTGARLCTLQEKESACLGTAILAGVGVGVYPSIEAACEKLVHTKKTYEPSGTDYTDPYNRYKKLDALLNNPKDKIK